MRHFKYLFLGALLTAFSTIASVNAATYVKDSDLTAESTVATGDTVILFDLSATNTVKATIANIFASAANVGAATIVTTGALNTGSITSGFGAIDNGTSGITTGADISLDVDGVAATSGRLLMGAGGDGEFYFDGTDFVLDYDVLNSGTSDFRIQENTTDMFTILTGGNAIFGGTIPKVTIGDAGAEDTSIVYDGAAQDYYIGLDDTDDSLHFGLGSTVGTTERFKINAADLGVVFGDATAADVWIEFDGAAQNFHVGIDDSSDKLVIGLGSALGTTERMTFNSGDLGILIGDATAADVWFTFDGTAQDYYIGIDDGTDDLMIGLGNAMGTTPAIEIDENLKVTVNLGIVTTALALTPDAVSGATITEGVTSVTVGAVTNDANDWIVLPAIANVPVGHQIRICNNAGTNFELRTVAASNVKINTVDSDGTQEYLCVDAEIIVITKVTDADGWAAYDIPALGGVGVATVPD